MKNFILILSIGLCLSACEDPRQIELEVKAPTHCDSWDQILGKYGALYGDKNAVRASADGSKKILWLNPTRIRRLLLQGNASLLVSALRVHIAKLNLNKSRHDLLPTVSLGALAAPVTNPSFMLNSVEYFLPFLLPGKWVALFQASTLYDAERLGFLIEDLNELASAYSLYEALQADYMGRSFLNDMLQDAINLARIEAQQERLGNAKPIDRNRVLENVEAADANLQNSEEVINGEMAELRKALGLCVDVDLALEEHHLPPSMLETTSLNRAIAEALARSPEMMQATKFWIADNQGMWGTAVSIFGDVGVTEVAGAGASPSKGVGGLVPTRGLTWGFSKSKATASINIGVDTIDTFNIASAQRDTLKAQLFGTQAEITSTLEAGLKNIRPDIQKLEDLESAEANAKQIYKDDQTLFQAGNIDWTTLTTDKSNWITASLASIAALLEVDLMRINFHRIMRTEEFEKVSGCWTENKVASGKLSGPCDDATIQRKLLGRKAK